MRRARWLSAARDAFPWTPLGMSVGIGAVLALRIFAFAQLDLVWLVAGYAALGLGALASVWVVVAALWLRARARAACELGTGALRLETGVPCDTEYRLPALRFLPLLQTRWQWLQPQAADVAPRIERGVRREWVTLPERGEHEIIERRVIVEDPFGLCRVAFRVRQARTLRVLPRLAALRSLPRLSSLAVGDELPMPMGLEDGDRVELQRYSPGDPARFIHWKVFARTRRLMVRKPERAVSIARRCVAFFVASEQDDATAAVARLSIERGLLGNDWTFGTDLAPEGADRQEAALVLLMQSVHAREHAASAMPAFLAASDRKGPASVVVFVPAEPGAWLQRVLDASRRRQVRAVIGVDGLTQAAPRPWWARLLAVDLPQSNAARSEALETVVGSLTRGGISVSVIDRSTGRALGELQRRALARGAGSVPASPASRAVAAGRGSA